MPDWMYDFYLHTLKFKLPCNCNTFYIRPGWNKWSVMACASIHSNVKDFINLLQRYDPELNKEELQETLNEIRKLRRIKNVGDGCTDWYWDGDNIGS